MAELTKATLEQLEVIGGVILDVFGTDVEAFRASLAEIKTNTEKVTLENRIAEIRKEMQEYNDNKEAEIQALLSM